MNLKKLVILMSLCLGISSSVNARPLWIHGIVSDAYKIGFNQEGVESMKLLNTNANFQVSINDRVIDQVISVTGSLPIHDPDQDSSFIRQRPGNHKVIHIKLSRPLSNTAEFRDWFKTVRDGKTDRRSVTIKFLTDNHGTGMVNSSQIHVYECWPKSLRLFPVIDLALECSDSWTIK